MKAIVLNNNGKLCLEDVKNPIAKDGEVLVRIIASGFNPVDYQMLETGKERKLMHSPILGREFSGIITDVGKNVKGFKPGDEIFCGSGSMGSNGTYAEYIVVPEAVIAYKPKNISFEEAAAIPSAGLTALQCFNRLSPINDKTIFITGAAGGVGAMFTKIVLSKGHSNFVVTAGNQKSIQSLIEIGVRQQQIIDYTINDVQQKALALNNNQKFDIVVDLVGNSIAEEAVKLLKTNGIYLDVTAFSTVKSREELFTIGATIMNISNYAYSLEKNYSYYREGLSELAMMIEEEKIVPPAVEIMGTLNVATVLNAHEVLKNNKTNGKKIIMQIHK